MSNYRRWFVPGGTYFFTVVTYNRARILTSDAARPVLRQAFLKVKRHYPFEQLAVVLLPDHMHAIWSLPPGDSDYDLRWKRIKEEFTKAWCQQSHVTQEVTMSQKFRGGRGVWQSRFWEHTIQDEHDLEAHFDYIHWNPGKHELVDDVQNWPWSSFHKYRASGHYCAGWGANEPQTYIGIDSFGEPE